MNILQEIFSGHYEEIKTDRKVSNRDNTDRIETE